MSGFSALAGDCPLLVLIHGSKAALAMLPAAVFTLICAHVYLLTCESTFPFPRRHLNNDLLRIDAFGALSLRIKKREMMAY